jgi:hypothetical protein
MRKPLRILFLTSANNSLSQRLWIELGERGHEIRVCVAATGVAMIAAISREAPDLNHRTDAEDRHSKRGLVAPSLPDRASRNQGRSGPLLARLGDRQPREDLGRNDRGGGGRIRCGPDLGLARIRPGGRCSRAAMPEPAARCWRSRRTTSMQGQGSS